MSPDIILLLCIAIAGLWRAHRERLQHIREIEAEMLRNRARGNYGRPES
jgi:hypothetical protein